MKKLLLPFVILALIIPAGTPALADEPEPAPELTARPQWQQLFPPVSPSPRSDHAMAYDTARRVGVVFGGANSGGTPLDDTWEWDSATMTWTESFPAHRPTPRYGAALVYDEARDQIVLFGGRNDFAQDFNDTWVWDGIDWTQVFPANSPGARWAAGAVYDAQRQVVVIFGGLQSALPLNDTWEWDGVNWTSPPVFGPSRRCCVGMAYDRNRNVTVLFGGQDFNETLGGTWERAGDGPWLEVMPPLNPSARERPGAAYFPRQRQVVMFGGENGVYFDNTFFWDGQRWRTGMFSPRPPGRCCFGMVYDPVQRGILVFGGSVSFVFTNDTWILR